MNSCVYAEARETRIKSNRPLHEKLSAPEVSSPPLQLSAFASAQSKPPRSKNSRLSSQRKSHQDTSVHDTAGTLKPHKVKEEREHRPSLAGFMFGAKDLADIEAEDVTERSTDDLKTECSSSGSSEFFKAAVQNIEIVDNTDQKGLYTGSLNKRTIKPHGQGTMVYPDAIYEGQWVNGDWCGFGRLTDTNTGDVYQGGFFDNMKHGLGVMQYADGRVYDGMFTLGKLEGKGRLTEVDGTKFWGYWSKEGVPHGRGKKEYPDGKIYDGEFDRGIISGHGRMTFPDGAWYLGEWCDGLPNGLGMKVDSNGDLLFEGMYSSGEPIQASSMRHAQKSSGQFLLYRNSVAPLGGGTLVGPLPRQVRMRHRIDWALKNL